MDLRLREYWTRKVVEVVEFATSLDVAHIRWELAQDHDGKDALFFRVLVLDDAAETGDAMRRVSRMVEDLIRDLLSPQQRWGLFPYFSYRTRREQDKIREARWD